MSLIYLQSNMTYFRCDLPWITGTYHLFRGLRYVTGQTQFTKVTALLNAIFIYVDSLGMHRTTFDGGTVGLATINWLSSPTVFTDLQSRHNSRQSTF
jgi:hypothetical protein